MINVGIIGCGRIADLHYPGYRDNPHARILAVCDVDADRAETRRAQWDAERAYTNYQEMLRNPDVDAVEVLTPYETHERVAVDALKAEKHVSVQKPMTPTLRSADRMLKAAATVDRIFKVAECYVCWPPIVEAKKMIDDGVIGDPIGMRIKYICGPHGGWDVGASTYEQQLAKAAQGYGLETFDHGHHEWATAWYLLGEVERVSAWVDSEDGVLDCPSTIMWKCRGNKRYGMIDFMYGSDFHVPTKYYPNDEWYEITGTRGILLINRGTGGILEGPIISVFNHDGWKHYDNIPSDWGEGFIGSTRNFIAAIRREEPALLTGQQGREVLRFATAVQRSAGKRREVYLDEFERTFPALHSWRRRRKERKDVIVGRPRLNRLSSLGSTSRYAPQATDLVLQMPERFDATKVKDWEGVVGLHLLKDRGAREEKFALRIGGDKLEVVQGELPEDALVTLRMKAGVWAAILLGKKRIETAVLTGKIKYEGRAEEALNLRSAFGL